VCKFNEKRVFSNSEVLAKVKELNIEFVVVDDTLREERIAKDLLRAGRSNIPVNLIYPPNYPDEPAVILEENFGPAKALKALERMEEVLNLLGDSNP
jgi:thiol:disulfide interchange protein